MIVAMAFACSGGEGTPSRVVPVDLDNSLSQWAEAIAVVPQVRVPQVPSGAVRVFLRVPADSVLEVTSDEVPLPYPLLSYPPGTVADRVETRSGPTGERIVDVRGTRIDADGLRWHHVFRAVSGQADTPLVGVEWPAQDEDAHAEAVALLVQRMQAAGLKGPFDAIVDKLDCDSCHVPLRPTNERNGAFGLVNRGTDSAGFFAPSTVFWPEVPMERYGLDHNLTDDFIEIRCPSGDLPVRTVSAQPRAQCADGDVPMGRLALEAALTAHDPHALAHCASRRALIEKLGDKPVVGVSACAEVR